MYLKLNGKQKVTKGKESGCATTIDISNETHSNGYELRIQLAESCASPMGERMLSVYVDSHHTNAHTYTWAQPPSHMGQRQIDFFASGKSIHAFNFIKNLIPIVCR